MKKGTFQCLMSLLGFAFLFGCNSPEKWVFQQEISLNDMSPIGLIVDEEHLWFSDVANNRIVKTDVNGKVVKEYGNFERPMHIAIHQSKLYIPEYTTDTLKVFADGKTEVLSLGITPDAPSSIAVSDEAIAVADFYNNRILFQIHNKTILIGKEGHDQGELYYPTDVEIYDGKIYVADAYNNRVQVFDQHGQSLQMIGESENIQVAIGIHIGDSSLFITDFEGNRILIYDLEGNLKQILHEYLYKPTDVYQYQKQLFVSNYGSNSILVFRVQ